MADSGFERVCRVVEEALDLPPERRDAHVAAELAGHEAREARRLLAEVAGSPDFLRPLEGADLAGALGLPPEVGGATADPTGATTIGGYVVRGVVAAGGMGTVHLAEQTSPRRLVALKTIHPHLASPTGLRRFRVEAEVLANLRHPHIAQIYEAGVHVEGEGPLARRLPWLALEYVEGARTLADWARGEAPGLERVLDLMAKVAKAVHHAHQRGVIHRDLKPGNVLVDPAGEPKVIDFGVARAVDAPGGSRAEALLTATGDVVGTLGTMAPEQIAGDPARVDLRCDVYALGMMLYELACGRPPYDVAGVPLARAAQVIQDTPPRRPSAVAPGLPRELDWILGRALEKEPEARYATALDLALDLERLRAHEPVQAGPPTAVYRLRKFVRRHRAGVAAAALVLAALVAWSVQSDRLRRSAEAEARRASAVNDVLRDTLVLGYPYAFEEGGNVDLRVVDLLRSKADEVTASLADYPDVAADLRLEIGGALLDLGDAAEAVEHLAFAAGERARRLGELHPDTLDVEVRLASALRRTGDLDAAEEVVADLEARAARVPDLPLETGLELGINRIRLLARRGEAERAAPLAAELAARAESELGRGHRWTQAVLWALADARLQDGDAAGAVPLFREVLDARSADERDAPASLVAELRLAIALWKAGEVAPAEGRLRDLVPRATRVLGADHEQVLNARSTLAAVLVQRGASAEAEELLRDVVARRAGREETVELRIDRGRLAAVLFSRGALAEARETCERVLATTGDPGPRHYVLRVLVDVAIAQRDLAAARSALDELAQGGGDLDHGDLRTRELAARLAYEEGRGAEAYGRFVAEARRELGPTHRVALDAGRKHASMLAVLGRPEEALAELEAVGEAALDAPPGVRAELVWVEDERAAVLVGLGDLAAAVEVLEEAHARALAELDPAHPGTTRLARRLAAVRAARGEPESAADLLVATLAATESSTAPHEPNRLAAVLELAGLERALGRHRAAVARLGRALPAALAQYGDGHATTLALVAELERCHDDARARLAPGSTEQQRLLRDLDALGERLRGDAQADCGEAERRIARLHGRVLLALDEPELAERALRAGAECALGLPPGTEERVLALHLHGRALELGGRAEEAARTYARVAAEEGAVEPALRARLRRGRARVLARLGRPAEADLLLQEGLSELDAAQASAELRAAHLLEAAALYDAWGMEDAAAGCRALLGGR